METLMAANLSASHSNKISEDSYYRAHAKSQTQTGLPLIVVTAVVGLLLTIADVLRI